MYRGEEVEDRFGVGWCDEPEEGMTFPVDGCAPLGDPAKLFPGNAYRDVPGFCKVATVAEIEAQGWSLNPGRYVGVADRAEEDFDFFERLEELNEELEVLNAEARELEGQIAENILQITEGIC